MKREGGGLKGKGKGSDEVYEQQKKSQFADDEYITGLNLSSIVCCASSSVLASPRS